MSDNENKVGRPSKYTPELLEKAREYADNWQVTGRAIPTIAGLAEYCEVSRNAVYEWLKDDSKAEFHDIYARVEAMQELELIDKGLKREHDSSLTKMLLAKHGYSDKQDVDVTTNGKDITGITRRVIDGTGNTDA